MHDARTARHALLTGLGARVRELRDRRGWSRRALSEASGVSERFLLNLEAGRGNISVARLADVALALGTTPRDLIPHGAPGRAPVVALLGLRGAGKSTLGAALAERRGVPFVELDALIEEAAGLTLGEIFGLHGESYYRRLEAEVLAAFLDTGQRAILATGGGIVTSPVAYARLLEGTTTVWLRAAPEDHWHRVVAQGDRRPMAGGESAMNELRALLAQREPLYARAEHTVDTSGRRPEAALDAMVAALAAGG